MTSQNRNEGNFANDRERAAEAGQKGGQHSHSGGEPKQTSQTGAKSGQQSGGNFANDPQRASEAGRKGGEHSKGGQHGR